MRVPAGVSLLAVALPAAILAGGRAPSEQSLREVNPRDDFTVSEEKVPMRDGVKLFTLILTPKGARGPLPILLERTPYNATRALGGRATTRLDVALGHHDLGGGYIFVIQDLRGRFKSEGDYAGQEGPRQQWPGRGLGDLLSRLADPRR